MHVTRACLSFVVAQLLATLASAAAGPLSLGELQCEYLVNPLGIDVAQPRLSWVLQTPQRGAQQTAYQVLVASSELLLQQDRGDVWDTGRVASSQSHLVEYAGPALKSHGRYCWKVRVWTGGEQSSAWSPAAAWSMGLLEPQGWAAQWLGYDNGQPAAQGDAVLQAAVALSADNSEAGVVDAKYPAGGWRQERSSPIFRKIFDVPPGVRRATVSIAGIGYHELSLNGSKVGDHVLDPAFTRYDRRTLYVTHDVTAQLQAGRNALGVMLGNGFYNGHGRCAWDFDQAPWRGEPKFRLHLRLELADGSVQTVVSDASWKASVGPVVLDGVRHGEVYDARREQPGWNTPGFDDAAWAPAQVVKEPGGMLAAQMLPPMRVVQTIRPVSVKPTRPGVYLVDLGQNIAGWVQFRVTGPAGTTLRLRYSERARPDGSIDRLEISKHLRSGPFQTDVYILSGRGEETWEPRFSYDGFRWVEVQGWPGELTADQICGRVVHTDFAQVGDFACSNELLNTIQRLTLWSYRGNFHGYPTDCPHREKNGWTGDALLAAEQAQFNFENTAGYTKWLHDLHDEQMADGNLPGIVPTSGWGYKWGNGPAWDSAFVIIPWYLYQYRGDRRVLEEHYDRLKLYVDYMTAKAKNNLVEHGLGDWVPAKTKTPTVVTSSGYYYVDARIVAQTAALLGRTEDARRYGELAESIARAFNATLYKGDGVYANGSQTASSCALFQGLAPAAERAKVVKQLVAEVEKADFHLDTGILGAKYLFRALSDGGRHDLAYRIACQTTPPSYGDWIARDATTLWEDWRDGASRNHIMFGDISGWFHQYLAGLNSDPREPGFRRIVIRPRPVGDLTWAKASTRTPYGKLASHWRLENNALTLNVTVPANSTATVYVPLKGRAEAVTEGGKPAAQAAGVKFLRVDDGAAVYEVGSGTYEFVSR